MGAPLPPLSASPARPKNQPKTLPPNSAKRVLTFGESPEVTPPPIKTARKEGSSFPLFDALKNRDYSKLGDTTVEVLRYCRLAAQFPEKSCENPAGKLLLMYTLRYLNDSKQTHPHFLENLFFAVLGALYPNEFFHELSNLDPLIIGEKNKEEWFIFAMKLLLVNTYQSSCEEETVCEVLTVLKKHSSPLLIPFCRVALQPVETFSPPLTNLLVDLSLSNFDFFTIEKLSSLDWNITVLNAAPFDNIECLLAQPSLKEHQPALATHFIKQTQEGPEERRGANSLVALQLIIPLARQEMRWFQRLAKILPEASRHNPEFSFRKIATQFQGYGDPVQLIFELLTFIPNESGTEQALIQLQPYIYQSNVFVFYKLLDKFQSTSNPSNKNAHLAAVMNDFLTQ